MHLDVKWLYPPRIFASDDIPVVLFHLLYFEYDVSPVIMSYPLFILSRVRDVGILRSGGNFRCFSVIDPRGLQDIVRGMTRVSRRNPSQNYRRMRLSPADAVETETDTSRRGILPGRIRIISVYSYTGVEGPAGRSVKKVVNIGRAR